jgi:formimidoylglutamate deiminase
MYDLAGRLDPDAMRALADRAYRDMADAGYGSVGEFHYVHHQPDGRPYAEPNAMALVLAEAARAHGLEIVLLPAAYHRAGWEGGHDLPPQGAQRRFCDPDVETFLDRVERLRDWARGRPGIGVGVAVHSVRAVPASWIGAVAEYADARDLVRHAHACEQRRELAECRAVHGCTPIELLDRCGFLGPRTGVVHGIHVTDADVGLLARSGTTVISCPTTEGNLGDGHLPALRYRDARVALAIGSDSQVRIDPFEEARELESGARREGQTRHALLAASGDLWRALAAAGRACLGLAGPGPAIEIDTEHPDLAGISRDDLPYALATCASAGVVRRTPPARGR